MYSVGESVQSTVGKELKNGFFQFLRKLDTIV